MKTLSISTTRGSDVHLTPAQKLARTPRYDPAYREYADLLEGQEVISIHFEGVVGVTNGQIIRDGEVIDPQPSLGTLRGLFGELYENEFGEPSTCTYPDDKLSPDDTEDDWLNEPLRKPPAPPEPEDPWSFARWMTKVDGLIARKSGLSADDLIDQPYHCWYEEGLSPEFAANEALAENGFPPELMDLF